MTASGRSQPLILSGEWLLLTQSGHSQFAEASAGFALTGSTWKLNSRPREPLPVARFLALGLVRDRYRPKVAAYQESTTLSVLAHSGHLFKRLMAQKFRLAEWASIAEIIGSIAVVASLIFVGLELRQTSEQLQLISDIEADLSNASLSIRIAESPELSDLIYRGERDPESLSDQELDRFTNIALPRLAIWENTYDSYLIGNLSESDWKAWDTFYRARWNWPGYKYIYLKYQIGFGNRSLEYFADVFQIYESEIPDEL